MDRKWVANPNGHKWIKDEDGNIDCFRTDAGYHNGPECELCGYTFCEHCTADIKPCTEAEIEAEFEVATEQKLLN